MEWAFPALLPVRDKTLVSGVGLNYFVLVFNGSDLLAVTGRDKDATWRTTGTLCRECDWSKPRLIQELQNGLPWRTVPAGHEDEIDWDDPNVTHNLNLATSELSPVGLDFLTVGIEVMLPTDAPLVPESSPPAAAPVQRWRKPPPADKLKPAALEVAKTYQPDNPPTEAAWWKALEARLGEKVTRKVARDALSKWAPRLKRQPGQKLNRRK